MDKYRIFFILFVLLLFLYCIVELGKSNKNELQGDEIIEAFVYNDCDTMLYDTVPCDTFSMYKNHEKTLELYRNIDSMNIKLDWSLFFSIFELNDEKFALMIDSTTKVYKFEKGNYKRIDEIKGISFGLDAEIEKKKINLDNYPDIVLRVGSGGTYGDNYIFLFYNPKTKSLVYDKKVELRNVVFHLDRQEVTSYYSMSSSTFIIEGFNLKLKEKTIYNMDFDYNKKEVIRYDEKEKIICKDTLSNKNIK